MLQSVNNLQGRGIHATDGDIGRVDHFLFDDENWAIRYLVVDTSRWLPGRKVLISPISIDSTKRKDEISLSLTRQKIKDSPDIDTNKPVSRQYESDYLKYYGYEPYWVGSSLWGTSAYPVVQPRASAGMGYPVRTPAAAGSAAAVRSVKPQQRDSHLRSTNEVIGYYIQATDGDIGHVEDFLVDDQDWAIRYMIVDTVNWWPGKKVVISPDWIERVSWPETRVHVNLSRENIRKAPEYDPSVPINRTYEDALYDFYGTSKYWQAPQG